VYSGAQTDKHLPIRPTHLYYRLKLVWLTHETEKWILSIITLTLPVLRLIYKYIIFLCFLYYYYKLKSEPIKLKNRYPHFKRNGRVNIYFIIGYRSSSEQKCPVFLNDIPRPYDRSGWYYEIHHDHISRQTDEYVQINSRVNRAVSNGGYMTLGGTFSKAALCFIFGLWDHQSVCLCVPPQYLLNQLVDLYEIQ
jgi:hypothetical protein